MVKESKNKIPHARQIEFGLVEDSFMRNETLKNCTNGVKDNFKQSKIVKKSNPARKNRNVPKGFIESIIDYIKQNELSLAQRRLIPRDFKISPKNPLNKQLATSKTHITYNKTI